MDKNSSPTPEQVRIAQQEKKQERIDLGLCPECMTILNPSESCKTCKSCGWSACD